MAWKAEGEDKKYVELIMSMSTDALMGRGVDSRDTFWGNLDQMLEIWRESGGRKPYKPPVRRDSGE